MTPALVIFDCDGVLVDSEPASNAVLAENLTRHGLPLSTEAAMRLFVGGTMRGVAREARAMGADLPQDWVDEIYREIHARLRAGVEVVGGVVGVLDRLDASGVPYCVVSNGSDEKMGITLGQTGLAERFAGRQFSAHRLGVAKPDPELFLIAARRMGVAPDSIAVIEDSATGARGAARAGMACFGYAAHDEGAALRAERAHVFHDMADLPALLGLPD